MRPDARHHRPDPAYLRDLAERSGLSVRALSRQLGIDQARMRRILDGSYPVRYPEQYALERLIE